MLLFSVIEFERVLEEYHAYKDEEDKKATIKAFSVLDGCTPETFEKVSSSKSVSDLLSEGVFIESDRTPVDLKEIRRRIREEINNEDLEGMKKVIGNVENLAEGLKSKTLCIIASPNIDTEEKSALIDQENILLLSGEKDNEKMFAGLIGRDTGFLDDNGEKLYTGDVVALSVDNKVFMTVIATHGRKFVVLGTENNPDEIKTTDDYNYLVKVLPFNKVGNGNVDFVMDIEGGRYVHYVGNNKRTHQ